LIGKKLEEYPGLDNKAALMLTESVVEATRIAAMEMKQRDGKSPDGKPGDDDDDGEGNADMKLFKKKGGKPSHQKGNFSHQKGFSGKSFAKKRKRV
jgi:hypothetical protein